MISLACPAALAATLLLAAGAAAAQTAAPPADAERLYQRSLAATCAHCHGTEGRVVEGQGFVRLAGQPRDYLLTQLLAFRNGTRQATIMHQITKGYSEKQLADLAGYFAALK